MPQPGGTRRQFILLDAYDPDTNGSRTVQISYDRMHAVARRGLAHAAECGHIVPEILKRPKAVFQGIRWDEDEDKHEGSAGWMCYCGIPSHGYRTDGSAAPAYPDCVYLVFINHEGVAYNWRWERCDPDNPGLPAGHAERFKRRLK